MRLRRTILLVAGGLSACGIRLPRSPQLPQQTTESSQVETSTQRREDQVSVPADSLAPGDFCTENPLACPSEEPCQRHGGEFRCIRDAGGQLMPSDPCEGRELDCPSGFSCRPSENVEGLFCLRAPPPELRPGDNCEHHPSGCPSSLRCLRYDGELRCVERARGSLRPGDRCDYGGRCQNGSSCGQRGFGGPPLCEVRPLRQPSRAD